MDIVDRQVPLATIGSTAGPRPSPAMVRSVRRSGVIVPILLYERVQEGGGIGFHVIDGNRRIAAARRARQKTIPARVIRGISMDEVTRLTLASNAFRSSNIVTEFWAIRYLERSGVNRERISEESGLSPRVIESRSLLLTLDRRLFNGVTQGELLPARAVSAAKLPRDVQRRLGDVYEANGRLLKRDIDAARRAFYAEARPPVPSQPDPAIELSRSVPEEPPEWFEEIPESEPDVTDVVIEPVQAEPSILSRTWPTSLRDDTHSPGPQTNLVPFPAPVPDGDSVRRGSESTLSPEEGSLSTPTHTSVYGANGDDEHTAHPVTAGPDTGAAGSADMRTHVDEVPADLRLALRTVTQQAANRGVSEEAWLTETRSAYRRSLKQVSMTLSGGGAGGSR